MPVPDFQSIMLPLLKLTSDGKEHSWFYRNLWFRRKPAQPQNPAEAVFLVSACPS